MAGWPLGLGSVLPGVKLLRLIDHGHFPGTGQETNASVMWTGKRMGPTADREAELGRTRPGSGQGGEDGRCPLTVLEVRENPGVGDAGSVLPLSVPQK